MDDPVTRRSVKTGEFWIIVLAMLSVLFSAWLRAAYGEGLTMEELLIVAGAAGINWYGRTSIKRDLVRRNGKEAANA